MDNNYFVSTNDFEKTELAQEFLRDVDLGRWALMLGAGFSVGARNKKSKSPPLAKELITLIAPLADLSEAAAQKLGLLKTYAIANEKRKDELRLILEENYRGCSATWQSVIQRFSWRSVYTTNIDDVMESAFYGPDGFQKLHFRDYTDAVPADISPSTLQAVYLHGRVNKAKSKLIFSPPEYSSVTTQSWFAHERFGAEQAQGKIIYIGTRLDEPDFNHYLEKRLIAEYADTIGWSLLIDPSIERPEAEYLKLKKIVALKIRGQDFFSWLDRVLSERKKPIRLTDSPAQGKMSPFERDSLVSFYDFFEKDLTVSLKNNYNDFFEGGRLSYHDLATNVDCMLLQTQAATNALKQILSSQISGCKVILLHGASGCGKTASLQRVAYETSKLNVSVYWHNRNGWPENVQIIPKLLGRQSVLFIDDVELFDHHLVKFINEAKTEKKLFVLVVSCRDRYTNRVQFNLENALANKADLKMIDCNWLNETDIDSISKHLIATERLGLKLRGKSHYEVKEHFRTHSSRILLAAMIDAFKGKGHEEIVKEEYEALTALSKKIYKYVAMVESRREGLDYTCLARASGLRVIDIFNKANGTDSSDSGLELKSVIRIDEVGNTQLLRTRHPIIAETLVRLVIPSSESKDVIVNILKAISAFVDIDSTKRKDMFFRIGKSLLDQNFLCDDLGISHAGVENLFSELKSFWEWSYHYWLQRATFELHKKRRFQVAWDYCKKAIEIEGRYAFGKVTLSNICFHWASSKDNLDESARILFREGVENLEEAYNSGYNDPTLYFVAIRGIIHVAAKFKQICHYSHNIKEWIARCRETEMSNELHTLLNDAELILKNAELKEPLGFEVDISSLNEIK